MNIFKESLLLVRHISENPDANEPFDFDICCIQRDSSKQEVLFFIVQYETTSTKRPVLLFFTKSDTFENAHKKANKELEELRIDVQNRTREVVFEERLKNKKALRLYEKSVVQKTPADIEKDVLKFIEQC